MQTVAVPRGFLRSSRGVVRAEMTRHDLLDHIVPSIALSREQQAVRIRPFCRATLDSTTSSHNAYLYQ